MLISSKLVVAILLSAMALSDRAIAVDVARFGLTPEVLCVAGATEAQLGQIAERLADSQSTIESVDAMEAQLGAQIAGLGELESQAEGGDQGAAAALAAARTAIDQLRATLQLATAGVATALIQDLAPEQRTAIQVWTANAGRRVPTGFQVLDLSDAEWTEVEAAVRKLARSAESGELDASAATMIESLELNPMVESARSRLVNDLAQVAAVFTDMFG